MGRISVLVVDDSAVIRRLVTTVLDEDPDITVVGTAASGRIAINKLAQVAPDCVTLDMEKGRKYTFKLAWDPDGGESYLELYEDGVRVADVSGRNASNGDTVELAAQSNLRIRVGNAAVVRLRVNGITLGAMGGPGAVIEWNITRAGG